MRIMSEKFAIYLMDYAFTLVLTFFIPDLVATSARSFMISRTNKFYGEVILEYKKPSTRAPFIAPYPITPIFICLIFYLTFSSSIAEIDYFYNLMLPKEDSKFFRRLRAV